MRYMRVILMTNGYSSKEEDSIKLHNLDLLRFLGAIGIIIFHMKGDFSEIGHSFLHVFVIITVFFSIRSFVGYSFSNFLINRFRRLMIPWMFWSFVFLTLKISEVLLGHSDLSEEFYIWMILTGPSLHLWFLPFIFILSIFLYAIYQVHLNIKSQNIRNFSACVVISLIIAHINVNIGPPFAQWDFVMPSVFLGIALSFVRNLHMIFASAIIFSFLFLTAYIISHDDDLLQISISCFFLSIALLLDLSKFRAPISFGQLSFGVYLIHPIFISMVDRITINASFIESFFLVSILSVISVAIIRNTILGRIAA